MSSCKPDGIVRTVIRTAAVLCLLLTAGCPVLTNPCLNPTAATNCVAACAGANNPRRSCNACCNSKPQTAAARQACYDACNQAYQQFAMVSLKTDGSVKSVAHVAVEYTMLVEAAQPELAKPCDCERLTPCSDAVTDPVFQALPDFWRTRDLANFICFLSEDERAELLRDAQASHGTIFAWSRAEFEQQMAILHESVQQMLTTNGVEGEAQYTFYFNNLLYGMWGMYAPVSP